MAPQVTMHLSEMRGALEADGDTDSVREVRARGRPQGRGTHGGLPGRGSFSVLFA